MIICSCPNTGPMKRCRFCRRCPSRLLFRRAGSLTRHPAWIGNANCVVSRASEILRPRTATGATCTTTVTRDGGYQPMGSGGYKPMGRSSRSRLCRACRGPHSSKSRPSSFFSRAAVGLVDPGQLLKEISSQPPPRPQPTPWPVGGTTYSVSAKIA
jgi:hypothetical protein